MKRAKTPAPARLLALAASAGLGLAAPAVLAQAATAATAAADTPAATVTAAADGSQQVEITGRHYDNAVGTSDAASQGVVRAEMLKSLSCDFAFDLNSKHKF